MKKFSDRLRDARKSRKMTQQELAKKSGVSQTTISDIERGRNESSTELPALAKALGMSVDDLLTGKGVIDHSNVSFAADAETHRIPVINSIQAGNWREICDTFAPTEVLMTHLELSSKAFSLIIDGFSMSPDFAPGDRVIIDPDVQPTPGDFVAAVNGSNEATFKKYRERGVDLSGCTIFELVPLNQDYPTLRSDVEHISIIGTMMEHRKYRRR